VCSAYVCRLFLTFDLGATAAAAPVADTVLTWRSGISIDLVIVGQASKNIGAQRVQSDPAAMKEQEHSQILSLLLILDVAAKYLDLRLKCPAGATAAGVLQLDNNSDLAKTATAVVALTKRYLQQKRCFSACAVL